MNQLKADDAAIKQAMADAESKGKVTKVENQKSVKAESKPPVDDEKVKKAAAEKKQKEEKKEAERKAAQDKRDAAAKETQAKREAKQKEDQVKREAKEKERDADRKKKQEEREAKQKEDQVKREEDDKKKKEQREADARLKAEEREVQKTKQKAQKAEDAAKAKAEREEQKAKKEADAKQAAADAKLKRKEEADKRQLEMAERKANKKPTEGRRPKATHFVYTGKGISSPQELSIRGKVLAWIKENAPIKEGEDRSAEISIEFAGEQCKDFLYGGNVRSYLSKLEEMGHLDFIAHEPQPEQTPPSGYDQPKGTESDAKPVDVVSDEANT